MFKIVSKQKIAPKEFDMWVEAPRIAGHAKAGQFVVLRVNDMGERIPLTIADHDEEKGQIRLVFQVVGKTTAALSRLEPGEAILDISGPLGTPSEVEKYGTVLMVGGGVGIAALYPIIKALKQQGNKVITILGGRTSSLVVMKDECAKYSDELIVTTDDGSEGMKGVVTDAMKMVVERGEKIDRCWCIGPSIMMKFGTRLRRSSASRYGYRSTRLWSTAPECADAAASRSTARYSSPASTAPSSTDTRSTGTSS